MATTITNKRTLFDVVSESGTLKLQGTATITEAKAKDFNASIIDDNNHVGHTNTAKMVRISTQYLLPHIDT